MRSTSKLLAMLFLFGGMAHAQWTLEREYQTTQTTGNLNGYPTIELPWNDNKPYVSAIPEGTYIIKFKFYGRFHEQWKERPDYKGVPILLDVENRTEILIHPAAHVENVQGCIGVLSGFWQLYKTLEKGDVISSPQASRDYLTLQLRDKEYESFFVMFLDSKHRLVHHQELFRGTIDSASVPVREVVKEALKHNAAAMIVAHNHPSGVAEPSAADITLTEALFLALGMVGVKLLDHFVVGDTDVISLAEMGVLR